MWCGKRRRNMRRGIDQEKSRRRHGSKGNEMKELTEDH